MTRWVLLVLAGLLSAPAAYVQGASAEAVREVEEDNSLASKLATPHKAWGRPSAGEPVRALFFVYAGSYGGAWDEPGTRLRDVVELCLRFDITADAVLFSSGEGGRVWDFHGQKLGQERAERLLEKPYDLYVIGGFPMDKLPAKVQYLILAQVVKGAGLLYCAPGECEYLTEKRRVDPLPAFLTEGTPLLEGQGAAAWTTAYRLKAGRGVWLKYDAHALSPRREFSWRALAEYDYWMLLLGRAALWAAGREGQVAVTSVLGEMPFRVDRDGGREGGEVVIRSSVAEALAATVALELRRATDGLKQSLGEVAVTLAPARESRVPVALPRLRAGDYLVDAVVRSKRGVEASGAGSLTVESGFGVGKVTLDRSFVEREEVMTGKVALRGAPPANSALRVRFRDSYDRILWQQDFPVTPGQSEYPFEYQADAFPTILMRAEGVLIAGAEEVEMKDASFTVPKRRHGRLNFVMWDAPDDVLGYWAWRELKAVGMDVALLGAFSARPQPPALRAWDVSLVPYSTRILDEKDEKGYMRPVCWNDEPAATEYVQGIVDNQQQLREQGVFVYSLGDEGVTLGCCVHPACLEAYRKDLASQYGAIERLNASWGTTYASFDEVDLLDHQDNMEQAAATSCFPRWYDRQAFARRNLAQFSGRFVKAYRQLDPEAITGFEGTGGFGDDYDAILSTNTFYGPYPSVGDDIIRSAASRDLIRSNWMGYSKTADALADAGWRMVMKGMDSIWFWMWDGCGTYRGYLSPTLDLWPATAELAEEMRPVRQGLGDLLLQSKMLHSGIAMFYSVPSALSGRLEGGTGFLAPDATHDIWARLTYDLGLDFRYVTSAMVKGGALDPGEFKVLLLPMAQALGPEEAEAIRRFAEGGGTVIADVRPGVYDDRCKPMTPGVVDDLFGITRTGRGKAAEAAATIKGDLAGQALAVELPQARADVEVQPAAAEALGRAGETPVVLVNPVGSGRAILLNFQLLLTKPEDAQAAAARALLRGLYDAAGAKAAVTASAPDGGPLPLVETRAWQNGDGLVFGLWRQMQCAWFSPKSGTTAGEPVPAKVVLPTPRHVYDLRAGKYLGRVTEIGTRLRWGRAAFYLALPYEIAGVRASLTPESPAPGGTVTASLRVRGAARMTERHAVWVEVTDPQGDRPFWGRQVVMLEGGTGEVRFPVAYNDMPGRWRVRATELFSGRSAEAGWTVR